MLHPLKQHKFAAAFQAFDVLWLHSTQPAATEVEGLRVAHSPHGASDILQIMFCCYSVKASIYKYIVSYLDVQQLDKDNSDPPYSAR